MSGMNIHKIIRSNINVIHPDEEIWYFFNTGVSNVYGEAVNTYSEPLKLEAFFKLQTKALERQSEYETSGQRGHVYMVTDNANPAPSATDRFRQRTGDMIYRPSEGSWWYVSEVVHDDPHGGDSWVALTITRQVAPPEGVSVNEQVPIAQESRTQRIY